MRGATEMRKKLVRHGNSRALVIDRTLMELLGLRDEDEVEITVHGQEIRVAPVGDADARRAHLEDLSESIMDERDGLFRRLAE
jgi:antitoxin MazE